MKQADALVSWLERQPACDGAAVTGWRLEVVEGDVHIDQLDQFVEAGACGTAAVITPIGGIQYGEKLHVFHSLTDVGPVTRKLYEELTGIQTGDKPAPEGWIVKV